MRAPAGIRVDEGQPGASAAPLTLVQRGSWGRIAPTLLLLGAGVAALVLLWVERLASTEPWSVWLFAASVALVVFGVLRCPLLFRRVRIRVDARTVEVSLALWRWEAVRSVARDELTRFVATTTTTGHAVLFDDRSATRAPLVRALPSAAQARYVAERLAKHLGLPSDLDVAGEDPPSFARRTLLPLLLDLVLVAVAVAPFAWLARAGGERLGELALSMQPATLRSTLRRPGRVSFWTALTVVSTRRSLNTITIDEYPRLVRYVIEIERAGQRVARLSCDPWRTFKRSSSGMTTRRRWFEGPLGGCTWRAERAGEVVFRAWLEPVGQASGWSIERPLLVPKL